MKEERIIEKSNPLGKILLVLGFILIICGGIYFYYVNYYNNPEYLFNKVLGKEYDKELVFNNLFDINKPFKVLGNIKGSITTNTKELKDIANYINKLEVQYDIEGDLKNELYNGSIHAKYDDKEFIDLNLYIENKELYALYKDVYDNYLDIDKLEEINDNSNNTVDYEAIINGFIKSLDGAFQEEDYSREKVKIDYNDENIEAYKNTITINETNYQRIIKVIVNNLLKDNNFLNNFGKIIDKDARSFLNEFINDLEAGKYKFKEITLSLYSKIITNKVFKGEFIFVNNENETIRIENISDKEYIIKYSEEGNNFAFKFTIISETSYVFEFEGSSKDSDKVNITINLSIENIKEVQKVSVKNAKRFDELTEEELAQIQKKLLENEVIKDFLDNSNG